MPAQLKDFKSKKVASNFHARQEIKDHVTESSMLNRKTFWPLLLDGNVLFRIANMIWRSLVPILLDAATIFSGAETPRGSDRSRTSGLALGNRPGRRSWRAVDLCGEISTIINPDQRHQTTALLKETSAAYRFIACRPIAISLSRRKMLRAQRRGEGGPVVLGR